MTPHQSQNFARFLTRRAASDSVDSLASALVDSQVELNPHQVEAALFACLNPLSRGVLLADEVGLGKTIEAGLVISQRWAERRRRILIIIPANLRKQWHQELLDKFSLNAQFLESKNYNALKKAAASRWCQNATVHSAGIGAKPWKYLLVPHDAMNESQQLQGFDRFDVRPEKAAV